MNINKIQEDLIEEFEVLEEWMDKYSFLIDIGKDLPAIDPKYQTSKYLIEGCQSKVWLFAELRNGKVYYMADSDAIITRGIIALLIKVISGREPDEIINNKLFLIDEIGLEKHLSPTRANGLLAMVKQMKLYAIAFKAKQK